MISEQYLGIFILWGMLLLALLFIFLLAYTGDKARKKRE